MINDIELLLDKYYFTENEKKEFLSFIMPIINHEEFIKRYDAKVYPHHGNTSLGYHILNDAVVTYKYIKNNEKQLVDLRLAVIIAMFHDLYELPWQNSTIKKNKFINKHGFTHPIEAVINSITWFPEYFTNREDALIIIDGIIHHMFPFPVRSLKKEINGLELNNELKYIELEEYYKELLIISSSRKSILGISFSRSRFKEGRIVSKADKKVAMGKELKSFNSLQSCITGRIKIK